MIEKAEAFIRELELRLKDLPKEEVNDAINYYREYFSDAIESGDNEDAVMEKLGTSEKTADMIRVENSIARVRSNPGIKNYSGVLKNTFRLVTTPISVLVLSMFVIVSFCVFAAFFAGALCTFLGAIGALLVSVYEATKMPAGFFMEIIGTIGLGFMTSGLLLLVAISFYMLAFLFIRLSVWMIDKILRKPVKTDMDLTVRKGEKPRKPVIFARLSVIVFLAGFVLFAVSGLPIRYFNIFNSMKPASILMQHHDFCPDEVKTISIETAHSLVRISRGSGDRIELLYEKSDWLDYEVNTEANTLCFKEKSNGRLPLFSLVSLHESLTELDIILPENFDAEMIKMKSTGGHFFIMEVSHNIQAETINGRIEIKINESRPTNIVAEAPNGSIYVNENLSGETGKEGKYIYITSSDKTMTLKSAHGDIRIR